MRQFGGRFGGIRVPLNMVKGLLRFKGAGKNRPNFLQDTDKPEKNGLAEQRRALDGFKLHECQRIGTLETASVLSDP
jgi:hypothetical protein